MVHRRARSREALPLRSVAGEVHGARIGIGDGAESLHAPCLRIHAPTPDTEIADAVVWLCSDKASYLCGSTLMIDGGYTIQ